MTTTRTVKSEPIRVVRAEPAYDILNEEVAALVKGMLLRGDKQSDIAACFLLNHGRISEINTGERYPDVIAAPPGQLPPPAPYVSPYEMWQIRRQLWRTRLTLEAAEDAIGRVIGAVRKAEMR
jgi:hypothetical protein